MAPATPPPTVIVGLASAAASVVAVVTQPPPAAAAQPFANDAEGWARLQAWVRAHGGSRRRRCW